MGRRRRRRHHRPELAERVRLLRSHGEHPRYHHRIVGTTARLDALQAAMLRVKLRQLEGWNDDRRRSAAELRAGARGHERRASRRPFEGADHVYHLFIVRTDAARRAAGAPDDSGVSTAVHYPFPIHRTEAYAELGYGRALPVAERLAEEICTLPLFPTIADDEVSAIAQRWRT